jgi:hypothetical protein
MRDFKVNSWPFFGRFSSLLFGLMVIFGSCVENLHEEEMDNALLSSGVRGSGIYDAAHGGMEGFYFLPPMAEKTDYSGEFDPTQSPVVEISDDFSFNHIHAQFTMDGHGPDVIRVTGNHYNVNWSAARTGASAGTTYRIRVRLGNLILGYADVAVMRNGRDRAPDGVIRMNANETLPIKFRIEKRDWAQPQALRIELSWTPYLDLDSHLTGPIPGSSERFHIYYGDRGSEDSPPFAYLANDDTQGFEGETTFITRFFEGTYRFYVHNYSAYYDDTPLKASGARVRVYSGNDLLADFSVPQSDGTLWTVFEMDGISGEITPINEIRYEDPWEVMSLSTESSEESLILESIQNDRKNR